MIPQKTPRTTVTRDLRDFEKEHGNIYRSLMIIAVRANQINREIKEQLLKDLSTFRYGDDILEEIVENKEQTEVAKYYERLPKPTLIAIEEFLNDKIYVRERDDESALSG